MSLLSFFSKLFCGGKDARIKELESKVGGLEVSLNWCTEEKDKAEVEKTRLQSLCDSIVSKCEAAEADAVRLYTLLQDAIQLPSLPDLSSKVKVYPFDMTQEQWKGVMPIVISDTEYYTWDESVWLNILSLVQPIAKNAVGRACPHIADCENYTLTLCDLLSLTFIKAGLDRQGAFLKLLSTPHSYCGFMLPDYQIRVYEPITGEVVGWLGETAAGDYGEDTYLTQQAFFLS